MNYDIKRFRIVFVDLVLILFAVLPHAIAIHRKTGTILLTIINGTLSDPRTKI